MTPLEKAFAELQASYDRHAELAFYDELPEAVRIAEHGPRFADSPATKWWGRLLDAEGRAPANHVRLFWETETRGRRVRVTNVGAAFLPAGRMRDSDHPAYAATLAVFENYTHSDGNVTDAWVAGTRGPEDVWREWCRIGFATIEHAHRALNELASIAEAEWARDPFFDVAAAVKPFDIGPDNPGDAEPALHGPANWQAVNDTVRELMADGHYEIDDLPALELDRIGRKLWAKPVSAIRARRLAGQACLALDGHAANQILDTGGTVELDYFWMNRGWAFCWQKGEGGTVVRVRRAAVIEGAIGMIMTADNPAPRLWEHIPRGFFRREDA